MRRAIGRCIGEAGTRLPLGVLFATDARVVFDNGRRQRWCGAIEYDVLRLRRVAERTFATG